MNKKNTIIIATSGQEMSVDSGYFNSGGGDKK